MRGAALSALLVVGLTLAASPSHGQRPTPVMVLPFADDGPARELSDALELELELAETVLLSSPRALYDELDADVLRPDARRELPRERVADALALLEQQALVYAVVDGDDVVLALFRTNDAAIVWAERLGLPDAQADVRALAGRVRDALGDLHVRRRLPDDELVALGLRRPPPREAPAPDEGKAATGASEADANEGARASADAAGDSPKPVVDAPLPAGLDRLGRVTLSYAPSFLYYRACQPADPTRYVLFACDAKPGVPSTEVVVNPFEAPLGGALHLELFPLPFVGVGASASLGTATLRATVGDGQDVASLNPDTFRTVAGSASAAAVLRLPFGGAALGGAAGVRAGYHLAWAVTDEVRLATGARDILFPLLPTYFSHHALLGAEVEVGLGALVRLSLEADGLFGPHLEGPVVVGKDPFAVGGRARLGLDVEVASGLIVSAALEGRALSVGSEGTAPEVHRYTLALEPFESGQLVIADARFGVGLGYRY